MTIKALSACLVAVSLLVVTGWSPGAGAGIPELKKVEHPEDILGLIDSVKGSIGHLYMLDHLPATTKTLEEGFTYLVTELQADLVRDPLLRAEIVYGTAFTIDRGGETVGVFAFSPNPDFRGDLVYAVSRIGWRWPVFLYDRK